MLLLIEEVFAVAVNFFIRSDFHTEEKLEDAFSQRLVRQNRRLALLN